MSLRKLLLTLGVAGLLAAAGAATATAGDEIVWANGIDPGSLGFASLDGTAGGKLAIFPGATLSRPRGVAVDPVAGRIYWGNVNPVNGAQTIAWSNLAGTEGGTVPLAPGATVDNPSALAIDPVARRLYWTNAGNDSISWAGLDAPSTGGTLTLPNGAVLKTPTALAIDPVGRRLYWNNPGNPTGPPFSFADLDDGGGGSITPGVGFRVPIALAFDPASKRLYWSDNFPDFSVAPISFVNVDNPADAGSIAVPISATNGSTTGLTVDPFARRLYWTGSGEISFVDLNAARPTVGQIAVPASTPFGFPVGVTLLLAPKPVAPPTIAGGSGAGATLSCSQGDWVPASPATFPYPGAQAFAYQWTRNGTNVADATHSSLTVSFGGDYRCTVTASNVLGVSSAQTSAAHTVAGPNPPTGPGGSGDHTPPVLSGVALSHKRFRVAKTRTAIAAARKPAIVRGTTLRFTSNEAGRLSILIERAKPGKKATSHRKTVCRAVRKAVKHGGCTLYARAATLTRTIHAGHGSVALSGRIAAKAMAPGTYRLTVTARDAAGNSSKPVRITLTILKG